MSSRAKRRMVSAATVVGALMLLHLLGGPEATDVVSGTAAAGMGALLGAFYLVAWLATVVVAPVLVGATLVEAVLKYARDKTWLSRLYARLPNRGV